MAVHLGIDLPARAKGLVGSSNQAILQQAESTYRCYLPVLTGLGRFRTLQDPIFITPLRLSSLKSATSTEHSTPL